MALGTYVAFACYKESVALETSTMAGALAAGSYRGNMYTDLIVNSGIQKAYLRSFRSMPP